MQEKSKFIEELGELWGKTLSAGRPGRILGTVSPEDQNVMVDRLSTAIEQHRTAQLDFEGSSPLHDLVSEIFGGDAGELDKWRLAVLPIAVGQAKTNGSWWQAFEYFVSAAGLQSIHLADTLELLIASAMPADPIARASIYALLQSCGKLPTASQLWQDVELRKKAPVMWLDLIVPTIPNLDQRRAIVKELVRNGEFSVIDFSRRLEDLRNLGGKQLGDWLIELGEAFPTAARMDYSRIVRDAFGLSTEHWRSMPSPNTIQRILRHSDRRLSAPADETRLEDLAVTGKMIERLQRLRLPSTDPASRDLATA